MEGELAGLGKQELLALRQQQFDKGNYEADKSPLREINEFLSQYADDYDYDEGKSSKSSLSSITQPAASSSQLQRDQSYAFYWEEENQRDVVDEKRLWWKVENQRRSVQRKIEAFDRARKLALEIHMAEANTLQQQTKRRQAIGVALGLTLVGFAHVVIAEVLGAEFEHTWENSPIEVALHSRGYLLALTHAVGSISPPSIYLLYLVFQRRSKLHTKSSMTIIGCAAVNLSMFVPNCVLLSQALVDDDIKTPTFLGVFFLQYWLSAAFCCGLLTLHLPENENGRMYATFGLFMVGQVFSFVSNFTDPSVTGGLLNAWFVCGIAAFFLFLHFAREGWRKGFLGFNPKKSAAAVTDSPRPEMGAGTLTTITRESRTICTICAMASFWFVIFDHAIEIVEKIRNPSSRPQLIRQKSDISIIWSTLMRTTLAVVIGFIMPTDVGEESRKGARAHVKNFVGELLREADP